MNNLVAETHTQYVFKHSLMSRVEYILEPVDTPSRFTREEKRRQRGNTKQHRVRENAIHVWWAILAERSSTGMYVRELLKERNERESARQSALECTYTDYQKDRLGVPIRHSRLTRRSNSNQPPLNPAPPLPPFDSARYIGLYRPSASRINSVWLRGEATRGD